MFVECINEGCTLSYGTKVLRRWAMRSKVNTLPTTTFFHVLALITYALKTPYNNDLCYVISYVIISKCWIKAYYVQWKIILKLLATHFPLWRNTSVKLNFSTAGEMASHLCQVGVEWNPHVTKFVNPVLILNVSQ